MISLLQGKPIIEKDFVTILTHGVGYAVRVSEKVKSLLAQQEEAEVFIYTHVKEDALELYGFSSRSERDLFMLLLDVSGIGPKTALTILNFEPTQIITAVQNADTGFFAGVPRIGKKLAQKIIIDLRSKLGALKELDLSPISPHKQEVVLALQSLGFSESLIYQVLQDIDVESMSLSEAVKAGIQALGQK
jgi:Holliday junction DNA helicase RuvA